MLALRHPDERGPHFTARHAEQASSCALFMQPVTIDQTPILNTNRPIKLTKWTFDMNRGHQGPGDEQILKIFKVCLVPG